MDSKTKTILLGGLLITGGAVCLLLLVLSLAGNAERIALPTATTQGRVISRKEHSSGKRRVANCTFAYKVENKTYTINDTCGANLPFFSEMDSDQVEIIYQAADPSNARVNRQVFFYFVGVLGTLFLVFGGLLTRKGMKMSAADEDDDSY